MKGTVLFTTKPIESFRNLLFIKVLYFFLLLKIVFLLPIFLTLHAAFWEQVSSPNIKQLIFNFYEIEILGFGPYLQLAIGILIIICGLIFRPNYFIATMVFLVYFNYSRITVIVNDGSDKVLNLLLFLAIFLSTAPKMNKDNLKILQTAMIKGGAFLIMMQLLFMYFYSGLDKLMSSAWRSGEAMYQIMNLEYFIMPSLREALFQAPNFLFFLLAWSVILTEILFPFLVWFSNTKKWILMAGVLMHVFIAIGMSLPDFGLVMLIPYILFISPTRLESVRNIFGKRHEIKEQNYLNTI